jgi:uncharacterized protein YbbC (DUF1343 family)
MIRFGIDKLMDADFALLRGRRVGLFTNLSAVNRDLVATYDIFHLAEQVDLRAVFSPEHGLSGTVADGVAVASSVDKRTDLTIHSLYGKTYRPTPYMLNDIDVMVCDIQDVGVRYYTFLWTLTHIMEACGEVGLPVIILDRPNPLGGVVDGGSLDMALASLVGRYPIPIQHGLTLGEVVSLIHDQWQENDVDLTVVTMDGWHRGQTWAEIGRSFVPPSLNMPKFVTAQHYPGACLLEGTTLSEGRGTPLPFEVVGAPYIDAWRVADAINEVGYKSVRARPYSFKPTSSKYAGQVCGGIQLHIVDTASYRPIETWLAIIKVIRHLYPDDFAWLPVAQEGGLQHFDRLIGDTSIRQKIDQGVPIDDITASWTAVREGFVALSQAYRRYEG